ncbi:hypothetical protein L7F22_041695 [Adiantum nelumboides]|nr:hypothetical protein [Adiantum nelumboides]
MKVVVLPQGNHQGEDIEDHTLLGEGQTSLKSSKREERASLSLPMMVPLVPQTVLAFIQQFDAAFGDEGFTESSKLRHVAMHFQESARQWWASLRANGEGPRTWKNLRVSIMKQFLSSDAKDKVLIEWRSLKVTPYESIQKYVDKFWDLHLKATVYRKIDFEEQKQQFCADLPEDMNEYANSQRPKTISAVIHHTMVAAKINFQHEAKRNLKPMEIKEKHEHKGKNQPPNSSKEGDLENKMGEPSSSWQNFNFRDDEGSAQGMQALRLLLAKLQEAQANPRLKPSVNNLLMIEDLMLTSTQRLPSSVAPMHLEGGEGVPVMHGPMQANVVPHPLQGPLQTDGAKKKQYHGQERHVGNIREEGDFHDDDDEPPSRSRHKKRNNERRTKRSRRNFSGGSSSSFQSGRSSHGRFPKKGRKSPTPPTSPSSSPRGESSSEESSSTYKVRHPRRKHHAWKRAKKLKKFKEGGKSITFQIFDGSYGHVDKVLTFIQQFDAAFGGEDFTEASKLRNVAMHLTKSARHWWSTLCAKNQAPKTWKAFEQYAELKHILEEEWGEYFPHTLKEAAKKWIKQGKLSVKKYVQKIKELTRTLNEPLSEKRIRAWFLSGFNSRKLREQEVLAPTKKFTELVHRAVKLEQQTKKEKSRHQSSSNSSTSASSEREKSSITLLNQEKRKGRRREAGQGKLIRCPGRFSRSLA